MSENLKQDQSKTAGVEPISSSAGLGCEPEIHDEPRIPSCHDFVFLDDARRPYRIRKMEDGQLWLHYWSDAKNWVSLRRADEVEAMRLYLRRSLNKKMTLLYEAGVPFLTA